MTIEELTAETLTGRLAPYVQLIANARARGVRWRQIRDAIGVDIGIAPDDEDGPLKLRRAYYRAAAQVAAGKLASPQATTQGAQTAQSTQGAPNADHDEQQERPSTIKHLSV